MNITYDAAGRLRSKDFSPCRATQAPYTEPDPTTGDGTEVFNVYDTLPASLRSIPGFAVDARFLAGKLTASYDRGSVTVPRYDARARVTGVARRVAKPEAPASELEERYTPHWFIQESGYDAGDRLVRATTGADVDELLGSMGKSEIAIGYTARGVVGTIGSSYGALVASSVRHADGRPKETTYGDAAATTTANDYDARLRLKTTQTFRAAAPAWSTPGGITPAPGTADKTRQLVLASLEYRYDAVDNPTEILDHRNEADWPAGAKPVSRTFQYDDFYRVTDVTFAYAGGGDAWTSPFAAENGSSSTERARPAPHVEFPSRIKTQSFRYDWLGNTTATGDDAHGFYERSLGTIQNGTATNGPYQLKGASETRTAQGQAPRTGWLSASYDAAGNLAGLVVNRDGNCLPQWSFCSHRYVYDWDEVGNLARARRWDSQRAPSASDPMPTSAAQVDLRYVYGAGNERVVKTARDGAGAERHTVYVSDSLELRRAIWDPQGDYQRTARTEVVRLAGVGRVVYGEEDTPSAASGRQHVFLNLGGHLGSTETVIDAQTGELVEQTSFQPYGATESDYRPERWGSFREEVKFTGKEEDIEVGLTYFGHRYLAPLLGRWASADPLSIHALGDDLNVYAYVGGRASVATDPNGLATSLDCHFRMDCGRGAPSGGGGGGGAGRHWEPGHSYENGGCAAQTGPCDDSWGWKDGHWVEGHSTGIDAIGAPGDSTGDGDQSIRIGGGWSGSGRNVVADPDQASGFVVGAAHGLVGLGDVPGVIKGNTPEKKWGFGVGQLTGGLALGVLGLMAAAAILTGGLAIPALGVAIAAMSTSAVVTATAVAAVSVAGALNASGAGIKNMQEANKEKSTRPPPNPYGKKGKPEHQAKVNELVKDIESRGLEARKEFKVPTPEGAKGSRFVDVVGIDPSTGNVVEMHQVGLQTSGGMPVAREIEAMNDIEKAFGMRPTFHPYN